MDERLTSVSRNEESANRISNRSICGRERCIFHLFSFRVRRGRRPRRPAGTERSIRCGDNPKPHPTDMDRKSASPPQRANPCRVCFLFAIPRHGFVGVDALRRPAETERSIRCGDNPKPLPTDMDRKSASPPQRANPCCVHVLFAIPRRGFVGVDVHGDPQSMKQEKTQLTPSENHSFRH